MTDKETIQELLDILECMVALDDPYRVGKKTLEKHGYSQDKRFLLKATEFVAQKASEALEQHGRIITTLKIN